MPLWDGFHRADEDDLRAALGIPAPPLLTCPTLAELVYRNNTRGTDEDRQKTRQRREVSGKAELVERIYERYPDADTYLFQMQCHQAAEFQKVVDVGLEELAAGCNTQPGEEKAFVRFQVLGKTQGNEDYEVDVVCVENDQRILDRLRKDNEDRADVDFGDGVVDDEASVNPWWANWLVEVKGHPEVVLATAGNWINRTLTLYFPSGRPHAVTPKSPIILRPVKFVKPSLQHFFHTQCLRLRVLEQKLPLEAKDLLSQIVNPNDGPGEYAQVQGFKPAPTSAAPGSFDEIIANLKPGLSAIQGPPGTGKSTAIKNINRDRVPDGTKTLVTCTKNKAVDAVVEKLLGLPGGVVVYGNKKRLGRTALEQKLNIRAQRHKEMRLWMQVSDQLDALELTLQAGSAHALDWVHSGVGAGIGLEGDAKNSLLAQLFGQHFWALMKKVSTLRTPFYSMKWRSKLLNTNSSSPPWHPAYNRLTLLLRMGACRIIALRRLGLLDAYVSQPPPAPAAQSATQAGLPGAHSQLAGCAGYGAPGSAGGEGHANGNGAEQNVVLERVQQEAAEPLSVSADGRAPVGQDHAAQQESSSSSSSSRILDEHEHAAASDLSFPPADGMHTSPGPQRDQLLPPSLSDIGGGSSSSRGGDSLSSEGDGSHVSGDGSVGDDTGSEASTATAEILHDGPGISHDERVPWELGWASPVATLFNLRSALMLLYHHHDEPDSPDKRAADALVQETLTYLSTLTASPLKLRAAAVVQKIKLESLGEYAGHLAGRVVDDVLGRVRASMEANILEQASAILCTIDSVPTMLFKMARMYSKASTKTVIIDEAGCVPEYELPLLLNNFSLVNLVLIGDHKQLPSFSKFDLKEQKENLRNHSRSLLQRIVHCGVEVPMMTVQYRMAHHICDVVSNEFYSGRLITGVTVPTRSVDQCLRWAECPEGYPASVLRTDVRERYEANMHEARRAIEEAIIAYDMMQSEGIAQPSVFVIAPYNRQVALLEAELKQWQLAREELKSILVLTVDKAQGSEADVCVLSLVKTSGGFAEDTRRMCVALSRARKLSVLVGNTDFMRRGPKWTRIIDAYQGRLTVAQARQRAASSAGVNVSVLGLRGSGTGGLSHSSSCSSVVGADFVEPVPGKGRQRKGGRGMSRSSSMMSVGGGGAQQPRGSAVGGAAARQDPPSRSGSYALSVPIPVPVPEPVPAASTVTPPTAAAAQHSVASQGAQNSSGQPSSHSAAAPAPIDPDTRDLMESFDVDPDSPDAELQLALKLSELMV